MATAVFPSPQGFDTKTITAVPGRDPGVAGGLSVWVPNTDVLVHDAGAVVAIELAGMRREDVDILMTANRLRIRGQRDKAPRLPGAKYMLMEIPDGPFDYVVDLPAGLDSQRAKAVYLNGFLRVDIPKSAGGEGDSTRILVGDA
jgi:HSP20 family protein